MATTGGIELAPLITKIKVDIAEFEKEMGAVKNEAVSKAKEVSNELSKTAKVGQNMSKIGGAMTLGLTVPLVGIGVAAGKMAVDFESSFAKVSTLLDANVVDYDAYKNDILDASTKSKIAVGDFSEAVYSSISAGVDQTKAIGFTTEAMKLAKGGFTTGAKAVDVMTTAINGYSMKTEDATRISDLLITTQNLGKTTVDELASSMGAVIPVASSVNFGVDELSASYAQLTKNGIATAESGTYLKAMLSELGKSGSVTDKALRELTGKSFAALKKEGVSTSEILKILSDYAKKSGMTLKDMFGSVEAGSAALVLARADGAEYNEMLEAMKGSAGATQEAFDKMDATPAEKFNGAINSLKNSGIKLGEAMVPMITEVADMVGVFAAKISKLTPEQAEMIVKIGATVAAIGPLLKVGGSLLSGGNKVVSLMSKGLPLLGKVGVKLASSAGTVGKVGGALSKLAPVATTATSGLSSVATGAAATASATASATAASGGLLSSLGLMAGAALPWVAGAVAIGGAAYGIYKVLDQDVIPEVDLFKTEVTGALNETTGQWEYTTTKISEETQKQVQSYMDLSNSAQQETMLMYTGVTQVTDESIASITGKVDQMASSIISANNTQKEEVIGRYNEMFSNTTAITAGEQAEIMKSVNDGYDARVWKTNELKDELIRIHQDISDNNGVITQGQQERIDQIYQQMKEQAVKAMSENEAEQNVILNRLDASTERITAEMVGDTIKQMNEARDIQVQTASDKRDKLVKEAEMLKTLEGGKYAEKAQKIIDAANDEYEGVVKSADKTKKDGIDKLMTAHSEFADNVDITTGEIVSDWDKLWSKWDKWKPETKTANVVTEFTARYSKEYAAGMKGTASAYHTFAANGLDYVPFDGYNARLHEGERVLTKKENEQYTNSKIYGKSANGGVTLNIPLMIDGREFAIATKDYMAEELGF